MQVSMMPQFFIFSIIDTSLRQCGKLKDIYRYLKVICTYIQISENLNKIK